MSMEIDVVFPHPFYIRRIERRNRSQQGENLVRVDFHVELADSGAIGEGFRCVREDDAVVLTTADLVLCTVVIWMVAAALSIISTNTDETHLGLLIDFQKSILV